MMVNKETLDLFLDSSTDSKYDSLKVLFIESAEQVVKDYLGYDPQLTDYTGLYLADGSSNKIQLKAKPVLTLKKITINGTEQDLSNFFCEDEVLIKKVGCFGDRDLVYVEYAAGFEIIPGAIKDTILKIAALKMAEIGNVGVQSKSYDNGGSRSYLNYTNFDKYLNSLSNLRIIRW